MSCSKSLSEKGGVECGSHAAAQAWLAHATMRHACPLQRTPIVLVQAAFQTGSNTTVVVLHLLGVGVASARSKSWPRCPSCAIVCIGWTPLARADIALDDAASHNLSASHVPSPLRAAAAHAHPVVPFVARLATMVPLAARQPRSPLAAARRAARRAAGRVVRPPLGLAAAVRSACAPVGDGDTSAPPLAANPATTTSVTATLHAAHPPPPTATPAVACRTNSGAQVPAAGFEAGHTPAGCWCERPLFGRGDGAQRSPYHGQKRLRPHRQAHVALPAGPAAHRVMGQADCAVARLDPLRHGPARARHRDLRRQTHLG